MANPSGQGGTTHDGGSETRSCYLLFISSRPPRFRRRTFVCLVSRDAQRSVRAPLRVAANQAAI